MKKKKRIMWKKIQDIIIEKWLFIIVVIVTLVFVFMPWWIKFECFSSRVAFFLQPLKTEGYKSSYVETIGALIGSFLAITGALWTQRREEKKKEEQIVKEAAIVVYYDFKFAFEDLFKFEKAYYSAKITMKDEFNEAKYFNLYRQGIKIYIDSNWITNVAKLSVLFDAEEIKQIYKIYGDMERIKEVFNREDEHITDRTARQIYNLIHKDMCVLSKGTKVEISERSENKKMMDKLKVIAERE